MQIRSLRKGKEMGALNDLIHFSEAPPNHQKMEELMKWKFVGKAIERREMIS